MKITGIIKKALSDAIRDAGGQSSFSRKTGISRQNISRYMNSRIESITIQTWDILIPHIAEYLPPGYLSKVDPHIIESVDESWISHAGDDEDKKQDLVRIISNGRLTSIDAEKTNLKMKIDLSGELLEIWDDLSNNRQRTLMRELIDEIYRRIKEGK